MNQKFLVCKHCGNMVCVLEGNGSGIICCGEEMSELKVNSVDASKEKHVPVIKIDQQKVLVTVGEVVHPMTDAHYIKWIIIQTKFGRQRKVLASTDLPQAEFMICKGDEVLFALAYCNLHGLWIGEK